MNQSPKACELAFPARNAFQIPGPTPFNPTESPRLDPRPTVLTINPKPQVLSPTFERFVKGPYKFHGGVYETSRFW